MSSTTQGKAGPKGEASPSRPAKRPYRAPDLKLIGTVADLTLGGGGMTPEGITAKTGGG